MIEQFLTGHEMRFLAVMAASIVAGFLVGTERESRGKAAGISTQCLVIGGAALFTMMSDVMSPDNPSIAAYIVTGVGFLGAGMIIKSGGDQIKNLTTAASVWFSAAIGMAIGFEWYAIAAIATVCTIFVPRIPHFEKREHEDSNEGVAKARPRK